jgi:hypothetical protein
MQWAGSKARDELGFRDGEGGEEEERAVLGAVRIQPTEAVQDRVEGQNAAFRMYLDIIKRKGQGQ